jgi:hypothetical protein
MTFENKCFVAPEDILSVRFQCKICKSTSTIPLNKLTSQSLQPHLMKNCPHCDASPAFSIGTSEMEHFIKFNLVLAGLTELLRGRPFEYGFEIECPKHGD